MEDSKYVRLNDGEIIYGNSIDINSNVLKRCDNIIDLLEIGDLVTIEYFSPRANKRISRLFQVDHIWGDRHFITLGNAHMSFSIMDNEFCDEELNPIIMSIITKEKLDSIRYDFNEEKGLSLKLK